jgi:hypothetical protein
MLSKTIAVIAAIGIMFVLVFSANAQESMKFDSEAKKLEFIRQMLLKEKVIEPFRSVSKHCAPMLKDLLAGKNFRAIEPVVRADSEDDPRLAKWKHCEDFTHENLEPMEEYYHLGLLGEPPYRYYRIELDGNKKNGPEDMIFHGESNRGHGNPGYEWVNLKKCKIMDEFAATGPGIILSKKPNAVFQNTLVYYKRKLWMIDYSEESYLKLKNLDISDCIWRLYKEDKKK